MAFFLRFLLSLLLIPVFLILLFISIPALMLITCVATKVMRNVRIQTFTAIWPPGQDPARKDQKVSNSMDENIYDVDCTVISTTAIDEKLKKLGEEKK